MDDRKRSIVVGVVAAAIAIVVAIVLISCPKAPSTQADPSAQDASSQTEATASREAEQGKPEPSTATDPTEPEFEPAPEQQPTEQGGEGADVVASVNGSWTGSDSSTTYSIEGMRYVEYAADGTTEEYAYDISDADVSRLEGRGGPGWVIYLGGKALLVPDASPDSPILRTDDGSEVLARTE